MKERKDEGEKRWRSDKRWERREATNENKFDLGEERRITTTTSDRVSVVKYGKDWALRTKWASVLNCTKTKICTSIMVVYKINGTKYGVSSKVRILIRKFKKKTQVMFDFPFSKKAYKKKHSNTILNLI